MLIFELKLKLATTSPGGWVVVVGVWWVGGWTKTKLMLFSTQVEVLVELKLELSLAIMNKLINFFLNHALISLNTASTPSIF